MTTAEAAILPSQLLRHSSNPADALRGCAALPSNSHQDAASAPGRFPVIGFNHGYTSYPAQQSALSEHLAANGYVVLSVGHPYESGGLVYPNGDAITMSPRILDDMMRYAGATESMTVTTRPASARRWTSSPPTCDAAHHVAGTARPGLAVGCPIRPGSPRGDGRAGERSRVAATIDHGSRGYMGMSYGGYIAAMLAQGDRRAKAAINLDGGYWTAELIDADLRTRS